jgi:hypothetical protein
MPLENDKLITPEMIGTVLKPVGVGRFKRLIVEENLSAAGFTTAVPPASPQVDHGLTLDPVTHKVAFEDPVVGAVIFEDAVNVEGIFTPEGHINLANQAYFINGDGLVNKGMTVNTAGKVILKQGLQVAGAAAINGLLSMGANIAMGANYMSNDGDDEGIVISPAGIVTITDLRVDDDAIIDGYISASNYIESGGHITAAASDEFRHGASTGWSGIIDLNVDNTAIVSGGIITGKT